jgi:hypothetical protein
MSLDFYRFNKINTVSVKFFGKQHSSGQNKPHYKALKDEDLRASAKSDMHSQGI